MAVKTSIATNSSNKGATWNDGKAVKSTANDECTVTGGFTVTWNSGAEAAITLEATATGTVTGEGEVILGTAATPTGGYIIKLDPAATWTDTGTIRLRSTSASVNKIDAGNHTLAPSKNIVIESGKYELVTHGLTACTSKENLLTVQGSAALDSKGLGLEVNWIFVSETSTYKGGGTITVIAKGAAEGFHISSTATIEGEPNVTFTDTTVGAERQFAGGGAKLGVVTFVAWVLVEASSTFQRLVANNKGNATGKGIRLTNGTKQVLTSVTPLTCNGEGGSLARIEAVSTKAELEATGTGAGGAHEVRATGNYEPANSFIAVKGVKWTRGTLYLPNGKDDGENENIVFGSEPGEGSPQNLAGTAIVKVGGSGGIATAASLKASTSVSVVGSGHLVTTASFRGVAAVQLTGTGHLRTVVRIAGSTVVAFAGTGHLVTLTGVNLRGTAIVSLGGSGRLGARASLRATAVVNVSGSGRISATGAVRPALVVYSTTITADRLPMTVTVSRPLPLTVQKAQSLPLTTLLE